MGKFRVRYYQEDRSSVRMDVDVVADSPEAARQRVLDWGEGRVELTEAEEESIACGKEEVLGSDFTGLEIVTDPYAVIELADIEAQSALILPLLENGDLLRVPDFQEKLGFDPREALAELFHDGKVAQTRAGGMEFWSKHPA